MRIALTLVIGMLLLLALISFLGPKLVGTSRSLECYVCSHCGMVKQVEKQRLGSIPYRTVAKDYETKVSRVLGGEPCAHVWLLYVSRPNLSRPFAPGTPGGDRVNFSIQALDYDPDFLAELAGMANRGDTWNSFVTALVSNPAFEKAFVDWRYISHNTNANFAAWAATNGYWSPPTNKPVAPAH